MVELSSAQLGSLLDPDSKPSDTESLLCYACSVGNLNFIELLIKKGADVNFQGPTGQTTPIMEAVQSGQIDVVELLLKHNANVNVISKATENTPLNSAIKNGNLPMVKMLLEHGADVEIKDKCNRSPVMIAISGGFHQIVACILDHHPTLMKLNDIHKVIVLLNFITEIKESPLYLCIRYGTPETLLEILKRINYSGETDQFIVAGVCESANKGKIQFLHVIIEYARRHFDLKNIVAASLPHCAGFESLECFSLLEENATSLDVLSEDGYTLLMEAVRENRIQTVDYLLKKGVDINAITKDGGETALTIAASHGYLNMVEFLISKKASINLGYASPLIEASNEGHLEVAKFLLDNGALVNLQCLNGTTALYRACGAGVFDLVNLLLERGAHVDVFMDDGKTALMRAVECGHLVIVDHLVKKGANVNMKSNDDEWTPLTIACLSGNVLMARLLLLHGADPQIMFSDNSNLLIETSRLGHAGILMLLLKPSHNIEASTKVSNFKQIGNFTSSDKMKVIMRTKFLEYIIESRKKCVSRCLNQNDQDCNNTKIDSFWTNQNLDYNLLETLNTSDEIATVAASLTRDQIKQITSEFKNWKLEDFMQELTKYENSVALYMNSQQSTETDNLKNYNFDKNIISRYHDIVSRIENHFQYYSKPLLDVNHATESNHDTALMVACALGHVDIVELLLDNGASLTHVDSRGYSALMIAVSSGRTNICAILIQNNADINFKSETSKETALTLASVIGRCDIIDLLLQNGAVIDHQNASEYSPVALAAHNGHLDAVLLLISRKADLNLKVGVTPLMAAIMNGHNECTNVIIDSGADVNAKNGHTIIHEAALLNNVEAGKILITHKCDINAVTNNAVKDNALTICAEKGNFNFMELLLKNNMNPDFRNKRGQTAVWLSASSGFLNCLILLNDFRANLDICDINNISPLLIAFRNCHVEVVEWLASKVDNLPTLTECKKFFASIKTDEMTKKYDQTHRILEEATKRRAMIADEYAQKLMREDERVKNKKKKKRKNKKGKTAENQNEDKNGSKSQENMVIIISKDEEVKSNNNDNNENSTTGVKYQSDLDQDQVNQSENALESIWNENADSRSSSSVLYEGKSEGENEDYNDNGWISVSQQVKKKPTKPTPQKMQYQTVYVARSAVSRIIGRGGSTISAIKAKTSTHIDIDTKVENDINCPASVYGESANIQEAVRLMNGLTSNYNGVMNELAPYMKDANTGISTYNKNLESTTTTPQSNRYTRPLPNPTANTKNATNRSPHAQIRKTNDWNSGTQNQYTNTKEYLNHHQKTRAYEQENQSNSSFMKNDISHKNAGIELVDGSKSIKMTTIKENGGNTEIDDAVKIGNLKSTPKNDNISEEELSDQNLDDIEGENSDSEIEARGEEKSLHDESEINENLEEHIHRLKIGNVAVTDYDDDDDDDTVAAANSSNDDNFIISNQRGIFEKTSKPASDAFQHFDTPKHNSSYTKEDNNISKSDFKNGNNVLDNIAINMADLDTPPIEYKDSNNAAEEAFELKYRDIIKLFPICSIKRRRIAKMYMRSQRIPKCINFSPLALPNIPEIIRSNSKLNECRDNSLSIPSNESNIKTSFKPDYVLQHAFSALNQKHVQDINSKSENLINNDSNVAVNNNVNVFKEIQKYADLDKSTNSVNKNIDSATTENIKNSNEFKSNPTDFKGKDLTLYSSPIQKFTNPNLHQQYKIRNLKLDPKYTNPSPINSTTNQLGNLKSSDNYQLETLYSNIPLHQKRNLNYRRQHNDDVNSYNQYPPINQYDFSEQELFDQKHQYQQQESDTAAHYYGSQYFNYSQYDHYSEINNLSQFYSNNENIPYFQAYYENMKHYLDSSSINYPYDLSAPVNSSNMKQQQADYENQIYDAFLSIPNSSTFMNKKIFGT